MNKLLDWFDDRTGYRALMNEALYENIPGGARWRYVWGSTLVFTFTVQVITGLFLWMCYSPSSRSAWESVYYIQFEMQGGWLLRGIHHFTAQAMVVLLALHLVQVVIDGAYKAPREVNFWLGLILMQIVLGLALTGYLLPWDQKGYWATNVATNLMVLVPGIGSDLQKIVVGGPTYGHATLTRFFALHAGVLPGLLIVMLALHIAVFRRHGITTVSSDGRPDQKFWPDQVLKDAVACLAVLAVVLLFVVKGAMEEGHPGEPIQARLGAELGAPADPANPYSAARPEWYFLFLFQFLKYFHGETEVFGAIVIPGFVMFLLFLMPLIGRWKLGHGFNVGLLGVLGVGCLALTTLAIMEDRGDEDYEKAVRIAEEDGERAIELAQAPRGIPDVGATSLLRNDSKTQGPILFMRHCASCHAHEPPGGGDKKDRHSISSREPSAPDLYRFGSREWIAGFLDPVQIDQGTRFFGTTAHNEGDMVSYVKDTLTDPDQWTKQEIDAVITALVAEADIEQLDPENNELQAQLELGRELLKDTDRCAQCHKFYEDNDDAYGPDLTGYRSRQWTIDFIKDPTHERFYGDSNDRMPAYGKNPDPKNNILTQREIELMVDWLRGDWYERGAEISTSTE